MELFDREMATVKYDTILYSRVSSVHHWLFMFSTDEVVAQSSLDKTVQSLLSSPLMTKHSELPQR